ncbi:MAG: hypothetical protein KGS60_12460 [Verrucomicrobia bacterium]|nr:hypothetical protein [Verrucomicrobiota bacterium]
MSVSPAHASRRGPVAVIAVHGVADQGKNDTAATAANLLLHLDQLEDGTGKEGPERGYSGFNERVIRVGVEPLRVESLQGEDAWSHQLREHLGEFEGEGSRGAYETIRLEGLRHTRDTRNEAPRTDRAVHIYELHWADVSRLKIGALNIFLAIYRLLFETSWLGGRTIGKWASFGEDVGKFSAVTSLRGLMMFFHTVASVILTRVMPLLYLLLIAMLSLTAIPLVETEWAQTALSGLGGYRGLFAGGVVFFTAGTLIGLASKFWRHLPWPPVFVLVVAVCFLVWTFTYGALADKDLSTWWAEAGVAMLAWLGMCVCVGVTVLPMLNRLFPGTAILGVGLMGLFTVGLGMGVSQQTHWPLLFTGPIMAIRTALAMLPLIWIVLSTAANLFIVLATIEGLTLPFRRWLSPEVIRRKRDRIRTAVLSLAMPVLLISFLNATFFQLALIPARLGGVNSVVPRVDRTANAPAWVKGIEQVVDGKIDPWIDRMSSMPCFEDWDKATAAVDVRFSDYANFAAGQMVIPFLEATFLLVILVLGYSLWTVAPAAFAEYAASGLKRNDKRWERITKGLGRNLSQGYRWLWAGQVLLAACLLLNQGLFAFRAIRANEVREKGFKQAEADPVIRLVDRFLGVRELKYLPESMLAAASPSAATVAEPPAPAAAPVTTPPPPAVVPPAPEVPRPPAATRPAPAAKVSSVPVTGRDRFGRPLAGRRVLTKLTPVEGTRTATTVQQQIVKEEREELARSVQEILGGQDIRALKEVDPAPSLPREEPKPGWWVKMITEFVVFLNQGPLTSALGMVIMVLAIGYLFFARLADPIFAGLRGGLDIALDVVNYLNPNPRRRTHRARILSRYASLLKYIADWRDPADPGVGYSRVVILAHSQGSVISSDLLRALSCGSVAAENGLEVIGGDPAAGGLPVRFYTMGSPLQQLYASRFPDLFAWDPDADPRPGHRGIECWWNAYRSGDYVGRMLFRTEKKQKAECFTPGLDYFQTEDGVARPVRETCIGPGAHTQYWNESAPDVIRGLDRLIATDDVAELAKTDQEAKPV